MRSLENRPDGLPEHLGLAHDIWAPEPVDGRIPDAERDTWLDELVAASAMSSQFLTAYRIAFQRWRDSFDGDGHYTVLVCSQARLLIGHGNPSPTEVGLTLHHTWGVPLLPGSALKGLLAHHLHEHAHIPMDRVQRLLGVAPSLEEREATLTASGDHRGALIVHDAWWSPPDQTQRTAALLHRDVLTPHHSAYYRDEQTWPDDHEDPRPLGFVTVRSGTRFLVALSCPDTDLLSLAAHHLVTALFDRGIGSKTTAGYGRLTVEMSAEDRSCR